jgi:hypothetical protein
MDSAEVEERKRRLVEESERYRQALEGDLQNLKAATAWVPKTIGIVRTASPFVALAAPLLGLVFRRKKREPTHQHNGKVKKGLVATGLFAFDLFRRIRPFWQNLQRPRPQPDVSSKSASGTQGKARK